MKLGKGKMLVVTFMLFSLFFGAGNLIFPPFLGQNAGTATPAALAGFLATAVLLPVLGVITVARFDGLEPLAAHVGRRFAALFTVTIYLAIGPGLGIPRAASVPCCRIWAWQAPACMPCRKTARRRCAASSASCSARRGPCCWRPFLRWLV